MMINYLETWLPQIIGYAELISGDDLWKVWVDKKEGVTSVTDFDELYEQIIGDLDSENLMKESEKMLPDNPRLRLALRTFMLRFDEVDKEFNSNKLSLKELLSSASWSDLKKVSCEIIGSSRL
jgi:hypothetical protein